MNYKKWILWLSLTFNVLVYGTGLLIVVIVCWHYPPLHPTWQWRAKASTHTGTPIPVKPYKELGRNVFLLNVDSGKDKPLGKEYPLWFVMDFSMKGRPVMVEEGPRIDTVADVNFVINRYPGSNILYGKGGGWHLAYTNKSVVFSNDVFSVSAERRDLFFRTTPEVHRHTGDNRGK